MRQFLRLHPLVVTCAACAADPAPYLQTDGGAPISAEKTKTYRYAFDEVSSGEIAEGPNIRIFWDDREVISASDATFSAGKVGLWTKADSITAFDNFEVTEL
jgi:hypothetical protein